MATSESQGVSSMPQPPTQYISLYSDENIKKGRAPKPPPPIKVQIAEHFLNNFVFVTWYRDLLIKVVSLHKTYVLTMSTQPIPEYHSTSPWQNFLIL